MVFRDRLPQAFGIELGDGGIGVFKALRGWPVLDLLGSEIFGLERGGGARGCSSFLGWSEVGERAGA